MAIDRFFRVVSKRKLLGGSVLLLILGGASVMWVASQLGQANKCCGSAEGKSYAGALLRAQQFYFVEHGKFTTSFEQLGRPIAQETEQYEYSLKIEPNRVLIFAQPRKRGLYGYAGVVRRFDRSVEGGRKAILLCVTNVSTMLKPPVPPAAIHECGAEMQALSF